TMWGGSIALKTPMLFALGFISMFIIGGLSGVMHSSAPSDAQQQDTYFIVAHIHYVLFGGSIFALFAGIYYWFPKFTGRLLNERLGHLNFWVMFVGTNITFFPMHFAGLIGMPRRIYTYAPGMGWDIYNLLSTIGVFILILGMLVFLYNLFRSLRRSEPAGSDPWDGRTLEWSISSPPPVYNFATIPTVHSRDAYWEQKQRHLPPVPAGGSGTGEPGGGNPGQGHPEIHMPGLSYWPILLALGLTISAYGLIYHLALAAIGGAITLIAIYGWVFEPASEPTKH
ncbi:MAG: cytochrome c oxidase subunit 4, partial [Chloroflexi bacterium]|nr:cytochrome c oxidase subunit 4 [Chloroflexota bacterium]